MRGGIVEADGWVGAGPASIKFHYDQGDEFFALWLGPTMTYSGAMWEGADDNLEAAQLRKLDYVAEQANAAGARRVLDIGCGWGGTMRRLVDQHHVEQVVGLTLSESQVAYVNAECDPRARALLQDWRTYQPDQPFDAIVSLGTIEHFVSLSADAHTRAHTYREMFARCREWLVPGGRLVLQTMAPGQVPPDRRGLRDVRLVLTKMYVNAGPPSLSELIDGCAGRFELLSMRNDRMDYVPTLMSWYRNLLAQRERAVELVGEEVVDVHECFFVGLSRLFVLGNVELLRLTLSAL